jgi:hypothetical protein
MNEFFSMPVGHDPSKAAQLICKQAKRIAELEAFLKETREICDAVAHVGVDFGYGVYVLDDSVIHRARLILEAPKETK